MTCTNFQKGTKNEFEASRTFGTLFSIPNLRRELQEAKTEEEFKTMMINWMNVLQKAHDDKIHKRMSEHTSIFEGTGETVSPIFTLNMNN